MSRLILEQLSDADRALRSSLYRDDLNPMARPHIERALLHVQEAYIATNEVGMARTAQQLDADLENVVRLLVKVRQRKQNEGAAKPIRI